MKNKGLGKGLSALINDHNPLKTSGVDINAVTHLPINSISPSKYQPRKTFDESLLNELAESIKSHGIIQPIVIRKTKNEDYEIIAGERRFRAAKIAGLNEVPVIMRNISDSQLSAESLIENIQRENLNPVEESEAYKNLLDNFNMKQEDLATALGKNRSHIANMLRICDMPESVKNHIKDSKISFGHAKVIAASDNMEKIAEQIIKKSLSVRQTEHLVKTFNESKNAVKQKQEVAKSIDDLSIISDSLSKTIGMKIQIEPNGNKGRVVINYKNYDELDTLIELISK